MSPIATSAAEVTFTLVLAVVVLAVVVVALSLLKKVTDAPLGTLIAVLVVSVVGLMGVATTAPESTPLMKTFMPAAIVTADPALLGAAVKLIAVPVEAALVKVEATGAVLTRSTVSLLKVTLLVPNMVGDAELLGV